MALHRSAGVLAGAVVLAALASGTSRLRRPVVAQASSASQALHPPGWGSPQSSSIEHGPPPASVSASTSVSASASPVGSTDPQAVNKSDAIPKPARTLRSSLPRAQASRSSPVPSPAWER